MANLKYETDVLDILHSEALVNIIQECAHHPKQKINKLSENFWLFCFIIWHFPKTYHFNNIPQSQNLVFLWHFSSAKYCTAPRLTQTLYIVLLYWIAFKLYLQLHNYLKYWLWSITHISWNIEVFLRCKDALGDPGGVYHNSDGLLVRVDPRSLTWAELSWTQPKSDSSAQLWLVDRLSYYKIINHRYWKQA